MLLRFISNYSISINIFIMIVTFLLTGLAYYLLAKKRNISKPWLAWVPLIQTYMIGKISDDINAKYNKRTHRGRWTLIFTITYIMFLIIAIVFIATLFINIISSIDLSSLDIISSEISNDTQSVMTSLFSGINMALIVAILICGIVFVVTAVISIVFQMISCYSIYYEYNNNKKALIYLVFSIIGLILIGSILAPIFVFISSKNIPQFEILNSQNC